MCHRHFGVSAGEFCATGNLLARGCGVQRLPIDRPGITCAVELRIPAGHYRLEHRQADHEVPGGQREDRPADRFRLLASSVSSPIIVDGVICYIGYLFPLDKQRQTLADKIMTTVCLPL